MSKCGSCSGKGSSSQGGGKGGSATGKYGGGGDSSRGYERAGLKQFKASTYLSDLSLSHFDRYALAKGLGLSGLYKPASPIERYTPPKPSGDSFFGMGAFYRLADSRYGKNLPMVRPAASTHELEERENRKKKFQIQ